jgi:hypothetical protein
MTIKKDSKYYADFVSATRIRKISNHLDNITFNSEGEKIIKAPEEDVYAIRDGVFDLLIKLERSVSNRLDHEMIESSSISSLTKLVDSYMKLLDLEYKIFESKHSEEVHEEITDEDRKILEEYVKRMAPRAGFEPATKRLTAACSTTELPRNDIQS